MNECEMIQAFAKLDGASVEQPYGDKFYRAIGCTLFEYNPIEDLALNCAARDKYKVENDFDDESCFIYDHENGTHFEVGFNGDIPRATIECILKSKGLWK